MSNHIDLITEYLLANYYDDIERMAKIKMVAALANSETVAFDPGLIDKVALFNGIKKTHPPEAEEVVKEFIEGVNFIMFASKTAEDWDKP